MGYIKQNFEDGKVLKASQLNAMDNAIYALSTGNGMGSSTIIYSENASNWERKTTSSAGVESTEGITQSNIMHKVRFSNPVYLIPKGDIIYAVITYDANGNFKARSSWYTEDDGIKELSDENPFNIVIGTGTTSDISVSEVLNRFTLQNTNPSANNTDGNGESPSNTKFLNFIQCCDISEKMVHFSCDDVCLCLYDLIQNEGTYTSIFNNSFFASLKTCHEATGACFTLNTFNTSTKTPAYDISNVPSKFQSDFQANKSWLRFSFHAENEDAKYASTSGAKESYNKFVNAIYKLTGDYECIDRIVRLGWFSGSLVNVLEMKNTEYGIIGLLTADDTRTSYYLTREESEIARLKGKYYDLENELIHIKTLNRSSATAMEELNSNPMYRKTAEFFWHEYEDASSVRPWVTTVAQECNSKGFIHGFPCDLYKPIT